MRPLDIIRKKRDGHALSAEEITAFVQGATQASWPEYQVSALLMAIYLRGMSPAETAQLTRAMVESGTRLDWSQLAGPKVDKHSTGGVGDKTSLILAPLAAACGAFIPMMSGRGLGHTGGTLDKLEAIPGFRHQLTTAELRLALDKVGFAMIGQTREVAPADKKLYALRDVTGTVESIPLITASIMCKKIAEGLDGLVLDVKAGRGAFMKTLTDARALAQSLVATGQANGVRTHAFITAMDAPLGTTAGNALEVREAIDVLAGRAPGPLEDLSVTLAAQMLVSGGLATSTAVGETLVRTALTSGKGLEKFRAMVDQQGGDPRVVDDPVRLPAAPQRHLLRADRSGHVEHLNALLVGEAVMLLGAGRLRVEDPVDPAVGCVIHAHVGAQVKQGDALAEIHYRSDAQLETALPLLEYAWKLSDHAPPSQPLILEQVLSAGKRSR